MSRLYVGVDIPELYWSVVMGPTAVHLQDGSLHNTKSKRATIRFPGKYSIAITLNEINFSSKMVKKIFAP